jgi:exodeoxyribonuclease VII large subunit
MSTLFDLPFEDDEPPPPAEAAAPAVPERRILTVAELNTRIRTLLEERFFEVWVEGELSNCKVWNNGHMYFTLKDSNAQIRGVMFRGSLRFLRFKPHDGLRVVARGRITAYEPKGEYQILCEHLEPEGLGALQLAFDQLKERLAKEGLFDARRKRPLPTLPRKIGVVTSLDGAAVRDIIKVLRRRHATTSVLIRPAKVQGEGAAAEVADGIRAIGRVAGVDVVIVGRGGGSAEDLWAFNEEPIARAIAACPVPVVTAVGHETDFTIADFVADLRAPTPSAAAEMVIAPKDEFCARIDRLRDRLHTRMRVDLQRRRVLLHTLERRRGLAGWPTRVALRSRHIAELSHQLHGAMTAMLSRRSRDLRMLSKRVEAHDMRRRLVAVRGRLDGASTRLETAMQRRRERAQARLTTLAARLESLSPLAVLARGYAVCWNDQRTMVIRSAAGVQAGDRVRVTLHEGELRCEVQEPKDRT